MYAAFNIMNRFGEYVSTRTLSLGCHFLHMSLHSTLSKFSYYMYIIYIHTFPRANRK